MHNLYISTAMEHLEHCNKMLGNSLKAKNPHWIKYWEHRVEAAKERVQAEIWDKEESEK
jgi:hypothetical protein